MPFLNQLCGGKKKSHLLVKLFFCQKNEKSCFRRDTPDNQSHIMSLATCPLNCCEDIPHSPPASWRSPRQGTLTARVRPHTTMAAARHRGLHTVGTKSYGFCHQIIVNTRSHTVAETQFQRCHSNQSHVKLLDSRMLAVKLVVL